ncbi:zinc-binding dehydrogenase [Solihabitans fulvus]|uniref:Zinc-binding dehydrogenase n=1 Tax=Solihabitans fulvus TaxID=1892852 RepID=A0A5B2XIF6_9PSEU|nr:zinc-binding dehydrogenase [Solihabitans fulvus]KAA2263016.1 zinc-binding dehydrogenase [Solihabitans fulvus]
MRGFITDPSAPSGLRLTEDLPEPEPAEDEFLLGLRAYAINPGEALLISQRPTDWRPGQDVAGVVLRAARDGSGPPEGARVAAILDWAGWAERVPVPTRWATVLDDGVSFEQAATLPIAGLTALRALRAGGAVLGRRVLITGATGGVGQFAVQLAAASGAHVTALVSGPDRVAEARELGAHDVVTTLDGPDLAPFHLVLDGIGGETLTKAVRRLVPGGTVALYGGSGGPANLHIGDFYASGLGARIVSVFGPLPEDTKGEDIGLLAGLVADGRLTPKIGWRGDWTSTQDAFAALAARDYRGKAVLTVQGTDCPVLDKWV